MKFSFEVKLSKGKKLSYKEQRVLCSQIRKYLEAGMPIASNEKYIFTYILNSTVYFKKIREVHK